MHTGPNIINDGLIFGYDTREFTGKIPITKIYNRVLTEQEIKQNYSAYKKRFN